MGNIPSKTNEKSTPGDTMPESELILANSLPALIYTIVPASIPICETQ
jgi:hypothetical protein